MRHQNVSVAVHTSPSTCVIAGERLAISRACEALDKEGVGIRPIKVDVASYSPWVDPLAQPLRLELASVSGRSGHVPLISSVTNLLGLLMTACDEETGIGMSDQLLRDESMTLLMAGHETTAQFLAWTWYLLSCYPDVRRRVEEEVDAITKTGEELENLSYTRRVLDESLRLYPPAWIFRRTALEDDIVGGYQHSCRLGRAHGPLCHPPA